MALKFNLSKEAEAKVVRLIQAGAQKDATISKPAQEAFASLMSVSLSRTLEPLSIANQIFTDRIEYTGDNPPEIPLDTYLNIGEGAFRIWSNGSPGGLAYNEISGDDHYRFRTYTMDSAIAWLKSYAAAGQLNVVQKALLRLAGEVLVKSQYNAFSVLAEALGGARTNGQSHIIASSAKEAGSPRKFQLDDLNRLILKVDNMNTSWAFGTPTTNGTGLTDLFVSPETIAEIRKMVYNPMNTTAIPNTDESTAMPLPDEIRMQVFRSGGAQELWGKQIHQLKELGVGRTYNELFRRFYVPGAPGAPTWVTATDELVIGVDLSIGAFVRVINADTNGATFQMEVDDQHLARSKKQGYFGFQEEGWLVGNERAIVGLLW